MCTCTAKIMTGYDSRLTENQGLYSRGEHSWSNLGSAPLSEEHGRRRSTLPTLRQRRLIRRKRLGVIGERLELRNNWLARFANSPRDRANCGCNGRFNHGETMLYKPCFQTAVNSNPTSISRERPGSIWGCRPFANSDQEKVIQILTFQV